MSVTYSERAKRALGEADVARTQAITANVLGEYHNPIEAAWDAAEDSRGGLSYSIQVTDPTDTARRVLEPDEVKSEHGLRFHLYLLMSALLRQQTDRLIRGRDRRNGGANVPEN